MDALANKSAKTKDLPETNSQSIYGALASSTRSEQTRLNLIRVNRRNTSFYNIRRILNKAEDEKHEIDIRILKFQRTQEMLTQLQRLLETEASLDSPKKEPQTDPDQIPQIEQEPQNSSELQIEKDETQNGEPIETQKNELQKRAQAIYEKHFAKRVEKLKKEGDRKICLEPEAFDQKRHLVKRIQELRVLEWVYEVNKRKKTQIVEILLNNLHPKIVERLRERVTEKLEVLLHVKANMTQTTWKRRLENNFYRSLDARSGSLQQSEKKFLSSKYFINNILDTERRISQRELRRYWARVSRPEMSLGLLDQESGTGDPCEEDEDAGQKSIDHNQMYESFIQVEEEDSGELGPIVNANVADATRKESLMVPVQKETKGEKV